MLSGVAFARYSSAQCAAYARDKLNGFEYPIGSQLMVHVCDDPGIDDGWASERLAVLGVTFFDCDAVCCAHAADIVVTWTCSSPYFFLEHNHL